MFQLPNKHKCPGNLDNQPDLIKLISSYFRIKASDPVEWRYDDEAPAQVVIRIKRPVCALIGVTAYNTYKTYLPPLAHSLFLLPYKLEFK